MEIKSLEELESRYREEIISRFGFHNVNLDLATNLEWEAMFDLFFETGQSEIQKDNKLINKLLNDPDHIDDTFGHWQIILSRSISSDRIIKIISDRNEYGKVLHKKKKNKFIEENRDDY